MVRIWIKRIDYISSLKFIKIIYDYWKQKFCLMRFLVYVYVIHMTANSWQEDGETHIVVKFIYVPGKCYL